MPIRSTWPVRPISQDSDPPTIPPGKERGAPAYRKLRPQPSGPAGLATVSEGAGYLRVDQRSLRRWIAAGEVRIVRFGRAVRIPWDELERLARSGVPRAASSDGSS